LHKFAGREKAQERNVSLIINYQDSSILSPYSACTVNFWNNLHLVRSQSKDLKSALASGTPIFKRFEINTCTRYAHIQDLKSTLAPGTLIFKI
jgi:hypothetical protein